MSSRASALTVIAVLWLVAQPANADDYPLAGDVSTIDGIIDAYYDVISGPAGHNYDAERDRSLHAPGAIVTRITDDGSLQRHSFAEEQAPLMTPYPQGLFETEIGRIVNAYGSLAHVWSIFEIRETPDGEVVRRGVSDITLYFHDDRWWIASWSTQNEGDVPIPDEFLVTPDE